MIGAVKTDLHKSLVSVNFLLSVIVLNVLIYSTVCVPIDEPLPQYTIGEFLLKVSRSDMLQNRIYSRQSMLVTGFSNQWLGIFISFLTAFACVPVFCDEYNSNCWRHSVERVGIRKYIASKLLTSVIVSIFLAVFCFGTYAVICRIMLPDHSDYGEDILDLYGYTFNAFKRNFGSESFLLFVMIRLMDSAVVTVIGGLFSLTFASLTMNKYIGLSMPVLVYFFFAQVGQDFMLNGDPNKLRFMFLDNSIRISQLEYTYTGYSGKPLWTVYIYFTSVIILLCAGFSLVMRRRLRQ
ncbi:MAG: hypothetical protein E7494_13700 [Ruminococcus albus]|jgi:hypothetical protein|nr:hypothetical protein [Ruminococcus albus]